MGRAEIVRQALPVDLFGVLPAQILQFLGGGSPGLRLFRVFAPELRRQIEGVCGHHLRKYFRDATCAQSLLDLP